MNCCDDNLLEIFEFLNFDETLVRMRQVSKRFKYLIDYYLSKHEIYTQNDFDDACLKNHIARIITTKKKYLIGPYSFYRACKCGNMSLVKLLIKKGANHWHNGLRGACEGGNMDIVQILIEYSDNDWIYDLWNACRGENILIVQLMVDYGACLWEWGCSYCYFADACYHENVNIFKFSIKKRIQQLELRS